MRNIKFRGKKLTDGNWIYGLFARYNEGHLIEPCIQKERENDNGDYIEWAPIIGATLGQYTGITDDYNMPIYEGDIVQRTAMGPGGIDIKGPIEFDEGSWWISNFEDSELLFTEIDTLEVIGNIYED